ncbi:hypothetical protein D3C76_1607270 [compost metagenome]
MHVGDALLGQGLDKALGPAQPAWVIHREQGKAPIALPGQHARHLAPGPLVGEADQHVDRFI